MRCSHKGGELRECHMALIFLRLCVKFKWFIYLFVCKGIHLSISALLNESSCMMKSLKISQGSWREPWSSSSYNLLVYLSIHYMESILTASNRYTLQVTAQQQVHWRQKPSETNWFLFTSQHLNIRLHHL